MKRELLTSFLESKHKPNTRRAYEKDLRLFFKALAPDRELTEILIREFLSLPTPKAVQLVVCFKMHQKARGLSDATVERRVSAVKALVYHARAIGLTAITLEDVRSVKIERYRDTTGVDVEVYRQILQTVDTSTLKGKRDSAILRLLWTNALRRNEVVGCDICDFDRTNGRLQILGKGKSNREWVDLARGTSHAIANWLDARETTRPSDPLFVGLDKAHSPGRLAGSSVYRIVRAYSKQAGVEKVMSPHRVRHSAITAALDASNSDYRKVQRLSRHADIRTLQIYDDNRQGHQQEMTDLLEEALG
ncbi:tyrosine-type recombinase/integrase [Zarconia navalis]|uniref:tyrosine-type recombinase/integrase n=1 Tax=Zarconia navalis TaxID=2992134 RepID=UPI0021F8425D|nr:tyrosine-type recombinase/integrase [Zarconia navalis]